MKTNNFKLSHAIAPVTMTVLMALLLILSLAGCYIPDQGYYHHGHNNPTRGPMIEAVKATCDYNYTYV